MLKNDFKITFVAKEIPLDLSNNILQQGFKLIHIEQENDFFDIISGNDIVVIDHYGLDTLYQQKIKESGCKLVCIDDIHEKEFYADLIINHAPGVEPNDYRAQSYTKFALGLDYVLLRPLFIANAKKDKTSKEIKTAFVCFGGSDQKNYSQKSVEALLQFDKIETIHLVVGSANQHMEHLSELFNGTKRVKMHHALKEKKMLQLMNESDLAIAPSSGILMEILSTKCTAISGYYVDNQREIYSGFKSIDAFYDAEDFSNLIPSIKKALQASSQPKQQFIDGNSDIRLLSLIKSL